IAVRHTPRQLDVIAESDGFCNQRVAFPMTDRCAEELWIRILRQGSTIRINVTNLSVCFDNDRYFAWRQQEFHWIGLTHNAGPPGSQPFARRVVFRSRRACRGNPHRFVLRCECGPPPPAADGPAACSTACATAPLSAVGSCSPLRCRSSIL